VGLRASAASRITKNIGGWSAWSERMRAVSRTRKNKIPVRGSRVDASGCERSPYIYKRNPRTGQSPPRSP
jgi:hypothetical protein